MKLIFKIILAGFALFMLSFFVFLYQVNKVPEKEWLKREAIVKQHYQSLAELHQTATSDITPSTEELVCPPEKFIQNNSLSPLYGPYLNRFSTKDRKEWIKEYVDWSWLIPPTFLEETDRYKRFSSSSINKAIQYLSPVVAVFLPMDEELNHLPLAPNPEKFPTWEKLRSPVKRTLLRNKEANLFIDGLESFATGKFDGWLIIVDRRTNELVCRGKLSVTSGERVDYEYRYRSRNYNGRGAAIRDDFVRQFHKEIATVLPEGVTVTLGTPHISVAY
ncbi:MAG: hypothetical protein SD837_16315 [Candidatus Electrothrix scaldis]|jgi:hypothetical protein|nr:MAG: hypothetical protein SD837_16315 [Candidatus Electrothrix sp. GW3-3]